MYHPHTDMRSFIPEEDRTVFEEFLSTNFPVPPTTSKERRGSAGVRPQPPSSSPPKMTRERRQSEETVEAKQQRKRRSRQHVGHVTDVEKFLKDIDSQMDSILDSN